MDRRRRDDAAGMNMYVARLIFVQAPLNTQMAPAVPSSVPEVRVAGSHERARYIEHRDQRWWPGQQPRIKSITHAGAIDWEISCKALIAYGGPQIRDCNRSCGG